MGNPEAAKARIQQLEAKHPWLSDQKQALRLPKSVTDPVIVEWQAAHMATAVTKPEPPPRQFSPQQRIQALRIFVRFVRPRT
jgi:hypothetical protein